LSKRKHKRHQLHTAANSITALTWSVKILQAYKTNYPTKLISLLFWSDLNYPTFYLWRQVFIQLNTHVYRTFFKTKVCYKIMYASHIYFSYYVHESQNFASDVPCTSLRSKKTSKTYSEVNIRILFSINFCLQDSYSFILVINLTTFFEYFLLFLPTV